MSGDEEPALLRSVALQNVKSILKARHRAEQKLRRAQEDAQKSAERLRLALDAGELGDFRWDARSDLVTLGKRAAEMFGLPPDQPITWTRLHDLLHEDDRERARAAVERALATRTDYDIEYRVLRPAGGECCVAARGHGTYTDDGTVLGMIGVVSDVSARRATENELRRSEELLRVTFEQAAIGIAVAGTDGKFLQINRRFADILGYDRTELVQLGFRPITHPEDAAATEDAVRRLLAGEAADCTLEKRYVRKDAAVIWTLTNVTLIRDAEDQPLRFIGTIEDITARRQTEAALRRSEQFGRAIIESSRDCIKTLTLDGRLIWISDSGCKALFVDAPEALIDKSWIDMWAEDDRPRARTAVQQAAQGGTGTFVGCLLIAGRARYWDVVVTPLHGISDEPVTLLAVSRDVTERVEIERALRDEARVLELLNQTGARIASQLDVEGLLQMITDAARELSGAKFGAFFYNVHDENGDAYQLFTLSGAPREAFERFGHPRATPLFAPTFRGEPVMRSDDVQSDPRYGQWSPHHGTPPGHLPVRSYLAVPVRARSGEVLGGLFFGHPEVGVFGARSERIVSAIAAQAAVALDNARLYAAAQAAAEERSHLLESERVARMHAERMSAMKDDFLAVLSHELRTPLSAILGWSQVLRHRSSPQDVSKGLEVIERNARVQKQLIEDLLDMSRIASGKMRLDVHSVVPAAVIEAAIETVRPSAAAKGIELSVVLDRAAGQVAGDAGRLQQVIWNLLSNAIKFTPRDGRVQVLLERRGSQVAIAVSDSGIGMSRDFLTYAFERFRQADPSTTRRHGGLGLGLAIVKHLVELHGGTVHAHSPGEGGGSTFTVKLPLIEARREDGVARVHPSAPPIRALDFRVMNLRGVRVLIVDDEPDARELVERILHECGADVLAAASAQEALAHIARQRFDVLVSDIGMPDIDGFELLRKVRALGSAEGGGLPAIALTAFARSQDRTRALGAGYHAHLAKPVEPSELVAAIASIAGRAGPAPE